MEAYGPSEAEGTLAGAVNLRFRLTDAPCHRLGVPSTGNAGCSCRATRRLLKVDARPYQVAHVAVAIGHEGECRNLYHVARLAVDGHGSTLVRADVGLERRRVSLAEMLVSVRGICEPGCGRTSIRRKLRPGCWRSA